MIPNEDSSDLTAKDVATAVYTASEANLVELVSKEMRDNPRYTLKKHELRRKDSHLYWRIHLDASEASNQVLVYLVDWLKNE